MTDDRSLLEFSHGAAMDLICCPWAVHQLHAAGIALGIEQAMRETAIESRALADTAPGEPYVIMGSDVTVLPIKGALARSRSWVTDILDMVTYDVLIERIKALAADRVPTVIIDADSPGGHAQGLLAVNAALDDLRNAGTTVIAYTDGLMASAMYHIALSADRIVASPDALVGSIGTVLPMYDYSKLFEEFGIRPDVVRSGPNKATPMAGEPITAAVKKPYQDVVDELSGYFFQAVSDYRDLSGADLDAVTDGRIFTGSAALPLRLIDATVTNFEQALPSVDGNQPGGPIATPAHEDSPMSTQQKRQGSTPADSAPAPVDAVAEARAVDAARLQALRDEFTHAQDATFVLDQFAATAGKSTEDTVLHAKAAYADVLSERLAKSEQKVADLEAHLSERPEPAATDETDDPATAAASDDTADTPAPVGSAPLVTEDATDAADPVAAYDAKVKEYRAAGHADPRAVIAAKHPDLAAAYLEKMQPVTG